MFYFEWRDSFSVLYNIDNMNFLIYARRKFLAFLTLLHLFHFLRFINATFSRTIVNRFAKSYFDDANSDESGDEARRLISIHLYCFVNLFKFYVREET